MKNNNKEIKKELLNVLDDLEILKSDKHKAYNKIKLIVDKYIDNPDDFYFVELIEKSETNKDLEIGNRYAVFVEDQRLVKDLNMIAIRNFGQVELNNIIKLLEENLCPICGMPTNGKCARSAPGGTGWYVCTCNWDFSSIPSFRDLLNH